MKKVIAFDLDGTLAESKSPLPDRISELLDRLLSKFEVCVMSGGKFEQFEKQLLNNLRTEPRKLEHLHLMPTCGTRYYRFDRAKKGWQQIYAEDFNEKQKQEIITAIKEVTEELGYDKAKTWGEQIEDRGSQVSWSALGQDIVDALGKEGVVMKERWDPDNQKKAKMREILARRLPDFEIRAGGATTIDITKPGIDKAYGIQRLIGELKVKKEEILFIGDRLAKGGNDYPVKAMGVDSIEISHWQETAVAIETILHMA